MKISVLTGLAALSAGLLLASSAGAATNLVQNGSFSQSTHGAGELSYNTNLTDWSVLSASKDKSYDFLFTSGHQATTTGSEGNQGVVKLYGTIGASPDGGAFIGVDPAYQNDGPITQTIHGLTKGDSYLVSFDYAGAQQQGFSGKTTEGWTVDLGNDVAQSTPTLNDASHGFTGWHTESFTFVADASTEVLSFLAKGGPTGAQPPFALLDGISLTQVRGGVPEPATWAFMIMGFGGVGAAVRLRRKQAAATA
jgi:hypothetical protein